MKKTKSERQIKIKSKDEMREFWRNFQISERQIILLRGEMGTGKTQSVLWLAESLGAHDAASPSFALHNIYAIGGDRAIIDHFDLFRLHDGDDLESTGFWDVFAKESGLVIIEWPERLAIGELPPQWNITEVEIQQTTEGNESRILILRQY
jgi:tRNA threonylcarbamoyladenosine biosynthesis protein TsaE